MAEGGPSLTVVLPTYCERDSLPRIIAGLEKAVPAARILVVDDASPDGTGQWAASYAKNNPRVTVLHREGKQGLASAYVEGFQQAMRMGSALVAQMDADGSHDPAELPHLLARLNGLDGPAGVIGSRWTSGGGAPGWAASRKLLSKSGNAYIRFALGLVQRDATSGFRVYRTSVLDKSGVLPEITSHGYGFQVEMTNRLVTKGFDLVEVPIKFHVRESGVSKLSGGIVVEELVRVTGWAAQAALKRLAVFRGKNCYRR